MAKKKKNSSLAKNAPWDPEYEHVTNIAVSNRKKVADGGTGTGLLQPFDLAMTMTLLDQFQDLLSTFAG